MMEGQEKNCIGVRCANESSCETVPQMYGEYEDLQIAHVSGRGLKNIEIGMLHIACIASGNISVCGNLIVSLKVVLDNCTRQLDESRG